MKSIETITTKVINTIGAALVLAFITACSSGRYAVEPMPISVTYADSVVSGSSIFTGCHRIITLTTPSTDAQISEPERVMFARNRLFVMDRLGNKILAFDGNGNYIGSTAGLIGRGHNEYIRVIDATVNAANGTVYAFCDAPYCVMVLDSNLQFKEKVPLDHYVTEVAQDSRYIYGMIHGMSDKAGSRIIAMDKENLKAAPFTVTETAKGVQGLTCRGKSITACGDTVLACLPYDNKICMIHNGKVVDSLIIDFGERNPKGVLDGLRYDAFLDRNDKTEWMIHNMACSDSLLVFNTNSHYVYVVDLTTRQCRTAQSFDNDYFPYSSSQMLPAEGAPGCVAYAIDQDKITDYVSYRERQGKTISPPSLKEAAGMCDGKGNPAIVVWRLK